MPARPVKLKTESLRLWAGQAGKVMVCPYRAPSFSAWPPRGRMPSATMVKAFGLENTMVQAFDWENTMVQAFGLENTMVQAFGWENTRV